MQQLDIGSMTLSELTSLMAQQGLPGFRAKQIYQWLHRKNAASFEEMTDLPASLRQTLLESCCVNFPKIKKKLVSVIDNTVKYLYTFQDGQCVETVLMRYHHGNSLCVSTQVGCRMGCQFCASTIAGFVRCLTPYEILSQLYAAERDTGEKVSSVVLMGIGEPLDNYDNVTRFLQMLSDSEGHNLSLRHLSLSTCGLVDGIDRLAREGLQLTLSISLHAPNDQIRRQTMPVARRWPMDELLDACRRYIQATGRRISFEYAMIEGVNDSPACAKELACRLKGMLCHVNLIPVNPVKERDYRRSGRQAIGRFVKILETSGIPATVRRRLGADINAACGQLRRDHLEQPAEER